MNGPNDGTRSVAASIMSREVIAALDDWRKSVDVAPLLIGGVAFGYHARPRFTSDIDLLFLSDSEIPEAVPGFKKVSKHRFRHNETHVEVEIVTPQYVNGSARLFRKVNNTAVLRDGVRIPTVHGLIAMKIVRFDRQDKADIEQLLKLTPGFDPNEWPDLPPGKIIEFVEEFKNEI